VEVGEPLYRPFPKIDDLLAPEPAPPEEDRVYVQVRGWLRGWEAGQARQAEKEWKAAAEKARGKTAAVLWETLAFRQEQAEEYRQAMISAGQARALYRDAADRMRCLILESQCLVHTGRKDEAARLLEHALADPTNHAQAPALTFYLHELVPPPPAPPPTPPAP
jgi:tetratricopeptide (TPR) repeat protein